MRPRGEIRQAIQACLPQQGQGAVTWRDVTQRLHHRQVINERAPAEVRLVRMTMENMVQAGELQRTGSVRAPGSRRPMAAYAPRSNWATQTTGQLDGVFHAWAR